MKNIIAHTPTSSIEIPFEELEIHILKNKKIIGIANKRHNNKTYNFIHVFTSAETKDILKKRPDISKKIEEQPKSPYLF